MAEATFVWWACLAGFSPPCGGTPMALTAVVGELIWAVWELPGAAFGTPHAVVTLQQAWLELPLACCAMPGVVVGVIVTISMAVCSGGGVLVGALG